MTRDEIVTEARRWLRTPYRKRGRDEHGIDCLGLLVVIGRKFEIPHTDEQDYSDWPRHDLRILRTMAKYLLPVPPTSSPLPGMVGIFAERSLPGHSGIFSQRHGQPYLIHARARPPQVVEECWTQMPMNHLRLIGLFDFPGVE